MNYEEHYNRLISRAKDRKLDGYVEKHHIIPKCMGGNNKRENIVKLTAEEHYVAHQLLAKIYPENRGLKYAVFCLTIKKNTDCQIRNNKAYGWVKREFSKAVSETHKGNSYNKGKKWTDEQKENFKGKSPGSTGKTWTDSEETKKRKSEAQKKLVNNSGRFGNRDSWNKGLKFNEPLNKNRIKVQCGDRCFLSIAHAINALEYTSGTLYRMLNSDKFPDYFKIQ